MIHIKNAKEIETMKRSGHILANVLMAICEAAKKPGMTELEIDAMAEKMIREQGGEPGFMLVPGYKNTICTATNDVVVHGIPTTRVLNEGDIIGIDCGVFLEGFHTDMAETIIVGSPESVSPEVRTFLETGKRALEEGIKVALPGNHIWHISKTIQDIIEKEGGYSIVRSLIGHGVGRELHEDPEVPGYVYAPVHKTPELKEGMTIAIEIIYNMGRREVEYGDDDWTIKTADGSLSGVFERSVVITKDGNEILTK
jgi:methionyl aminopeptidase